jgi:hypothetical protein
MATQTLLASTARAAASQMSFPLTSDDAARIARAVQERLADPEPLEIQVARFAMRCKPRLGQTAALDLATRICAG